MATKLPFDKYAHYLASVQSPEDDVKFYRKQYAKLVGKEANILREDFCGTFALSCAWANLGPTYSAIGIDLDPEPIEYGRTHYLSRLKPEAQARVKIFKKNVLDPNLPEADLVLATNFSYYCIRKREELLSYYKGVYNSLKKSGVFFMDAFGGPQCHEANEEETVHPKFSYFWDQESYNPITHEGDFSIHFKRRGEKKRQRVFHYKWRLWTLPELRDILAEAGFRESVVYWEGNDKDGEGNGIFKPSEKGDLCEAWVAYIAALK